MASFILKLSTYVLIALFLSTKVSAQCPGFCYCTKSIASRICAIPVFSSKCHVTKCTSANCGGNGYGCQNKPVRTPIPSPSVPITKPLGIISQAKKTEIQQKIADRGGCKVNVCFAIDGSGSIDPKSWDVEKQFVTDLLNIINPWNPLAGATQYDHRNHPIAALTGNVNSVVSAISNAKQKRGSTDMATGIEYCLGQIKPFPGKPNNVVVLGDGFDNFGKNPVTSANKVFSFGGIVAAVAAGKRINDAKLLELVGGNPGLKFKVEKFGVVSGLDLAALVSVMEQLAYAICRGPN